MITHLIVWNEIVWNEWLNFQPGGFQPRSPTGCQVISTVLMLELLRTTFRAFRSSHAAAPAPQDSAASEHKEHGASGMKRLRFRQPQGGSRTASSEHREFRCDGYRRQISLNSKCATPQASASLEAGGKSYSNSARKEVFRNVPVGSSFLRTSMKSSHLG